MAMLEWDEYRKQLGTTVGELGKLDPELVQSYRALSKSGKETGHLGDKTRELIALGVAVALRCDGCIAVHSQAARRAGATDGEIAEALGVSISVNAGAAMVYSARVLDALKSLPAPAQASE
jgi:AhpD family alkylhydroperoxidase